MPRVDHARLLLTAAALLGVACGGAPRAPEPDPASTTAQVIDGEGRCGVGSDEEEARGDSSAGAVP
jgi:hypothetical protein